jgi:TetR/AcrR family transcriptional regulator, copper-responsive repressor
MREFAILPHQAHVVVAENRARLQQLLARNIEAEKPRMDPNAIADMVLSFFSGVCIEHNLKSDKGASTRKTATFMKVLRSL